MTSDELKKLLEAYKSELQVDFDNKINNFFEQNKLKNEFFVPLKNYESRYMISNYGRLLSIEIKRKSHIKIIPLRINPRGYPSVCLINKNKKITVEVHRLVARNFILNPFCYETINHIDGNKTNNKIDNLEWVTQKQNCAHSVLTGLSKIGERHFASKLTEKNVTDIYLDKDSYKKISLKYNVSKSCITAIKTGKTWSHLTGKIHEKYPQIHSKLKDLTDLKEKLKGEL